MKLGERDGRLVIVPRTIQKPLLDLAWQVWAEAPSAPGFVRIGLTHQDALCTIDDALTSIGRIAALHADGEILGHELGNGHERRYGLEGLSAKILIESRYDDTAASVGQALYHWNNVGTEELHFVDTNDGYALTQAPNVIGLLDQAGL